MLVEEGRQARFTRPLGILERGPVCKEVAEHHGILVLEPLQGLGEVLLECIAQAVGYASLVIDQGAALLHQPLQGAHSDALRMQCGELVAVSHQQLEGELRVGGVVLGAT